MNYRQTLTWFTLSIATAAFVTSASAAEFPTSEVPKTEPEYIAKTKTAAPASIVDEATIVMMQEKGDAKTLQTGSNGFTCLVTPDGTPTCADANGWNGAGDRREGHSARQDRVHLHDGGGHGDQQSRSPCDRQEPLGSDWAACHDRRYGGAGDGRHLSRTLDPDPSQAYVMFPGTPYEHLMLPVDTK